MNILFLTSHLPFPPWSGGRLREYELLRRLGTRHTIEICAVTRTFAEDRLYLERVGAFAAPRLFRSPRSSDGGAAASSLLVRRNASREAAAHVGSCLRRGIDLVHCEGFYMRPLAGDTSVPLFMMEQNIEYRVWTEDVERIRDEERRAWRSSTCCGTLTDEDAAVMREEIESDRVLISFNGSDHTTSIETMAELRPKSIPDGPIVLVPGNFSYVPSYAAAMVMCTTIAPAILRRVPAATVLVVGNGCERLADFAGCRGIELHGRVGTLEPYYAAATVVACPLTVGGGIKVKILEALARGCAVVTTEVGRQGLRDAPVVVAGTAEDFVDEVVRLIEDHDARDALRRSATAFASRLPTWDAAAARLEECWMKTIQMRGK